MKEGSRKGEATRHRERKKEEPIGLPRRGEREWARETEGT